MYTKKINGVFYKTKKIKASLDSISIINDRFACDKNTVFYRDKPLKDIDGASFVYISDDYIRDKNKVWHVGRTKLAPCKADPSSFEHVGYQYGRDNSHGFYKGKQMVGVDITSMRALCSNILIDSHGMFYETKRHIQTTFDLKTVKADFLKEGVYYVWDKKQVWYGAVNTRDGERLMGIDPDTFKIVCAHYTHDAHKLFFKDQQVEGISEPKTARVLLGGHYPVIQVDNHVVSDGLIVISSPQETINYFFNTKGIVHYDGFGGWSTFDSNSKPILDIEIVLRKVIDAAFILCTQAYPISSHNTWVDSREIKKDLPPKYTVNCTNGVVTLCYNGHTLTSSIEMAWVLGSKLWALTVYGVPFVRYVFFITDYARGRELPDLQLETGRGDMIDFAGDYPKSLAVLTRSMLLSKNITPHKDDYLDWFSHTTYQALLENSAPFAYTHSPVTTNRARIMELVDTGVHHKSLLVRAWTASELVGLVCAYNGKQPVKVINTLLPIVLEQVKQETEPDIITQWCVLLDVLSAYVRISSHSLNPKDTVLVYTELEPVVIFLIKQEFNLDLNLARLALTYHVLGDKEKQSRAEQDLKKLVNNKKMSPDWDGMYSDYPSADSWLEQAYGDVQLDNKSNS